MGVTVVIPALNEQERIGEAIASARAAGADEIIVVDGGSDDATASTAAALGARLLVEISTRGRQLNRGAEAASHGAIVFLHADTLLPAGAAAAVERAVTGGACFGGFRISFIEGGARLRCASAMINARTRLTGEPWGDQAQFVDRDAFLRDGGFREIAIMEDYELARRMRRGGETVVLPLAVRTSGRRFLEKGVIRTAFVNWLIIASYHAGVAPERLARWYRGGSSRRGR